MASRFALSCRDSCFNLRVGEAATPPSAYTGWSPVLRGSSRAQKALKKTGKRRRGALYPRPAGRQGWPVIGRMNLRRVGAHADSGRGLRAGRLLANERKGQLQAVFPLNPKGSLGLIVETAKTQAVAGAAAGATLGIVRSIVTVHREQLHDGYEVLAEGMTQIGTGAVLGILSGLAASATGATVAAVVGRGVWVIAAPLVASAITSSLAHGRVDRLVRPLSADIVRGLRESLENDPLRGPARRPSRF